MLELLFCACLTILPDYLIKRYLFKKRWGQEINFYTIWYELRWGISACVILTVSLITLIFYYHPSTTNAITLFRTVTILPESPGRVEEVFVGNNQSVNKGDPLFRLESSSEEAAVATARSKLAEVLAEYSTARADLDKAEGAVSSAKSQLAQAEDDLNRALKLAEKDAGAISQRTIEVAKNKVATIEGELASAIANRDKIVAQIDTALPARRKTAEDSLNQALVALDKTVVSAKVSGRITQLMLQPGDIVNPFIRPAGLLIPTEVSGNQAVWAGFNQLASQVVKPGTLAEVTCMSKPFAVIPMVVTDVQISIAAGQMLPSDQMIDLKDRAAPGTLSTKLEPLYPNGLDGVLPGSKCIANAYTYNHDLLESGELDTAQWLFYHMVDTVGVVHAMLLRIQALLVPIKVLVFSGH